MFYQWGGGISSEREEGVWQCVVPVSRWDSLAAQSAPGSHGGGTWAPQVCEAGPAPLRESAGPLLRDPQEKHSEIQQLHFAHRLNDSSGKLPSCDLVHLRFALCSSIALWREKKEACILCVIFFCLCHLVDVSSILMYYGSGWITLWVRLALGKIWALLGSWLEDKIFTLCWFMLLKTVGSTI